MKRAFFIVLAIASLIVFLGSCSEDGSTTLDSEPVGDSFSEIGDASSSGSSGDGNGTGGAAGLITAAEWNDLNHWDFWADLINGQEYHQMDDHWGIYTLNRIAVLVTANGMPVANSEVNIIKEGNSVASSKTDNHGRAELWIDLLEEENNIDLAPYTLTIDGTEVDTELKLFAQGVNEITIPAAPMAAEKAEIAFMVDATGSMGDELEFLKDDLADVIGRVQNENATIDYRTATVFYRDVDDDYIVKNSSFTSDVNVTLDFINDQKAEGGGDFPEAVHTALSTTISDLQWSSDSRSRIAFLLLDAPPHYEAQIIDDIHNSVIQAAAKGIKLIPITASGIDKETEFLMRLMAISTNGTYVFITDDSGIGNDHLEASVGQYEVEKLNDLIVRLITKYSE